MKTATFIIALFMCLTAYAQTKDLNEHEQKALRDAQVEYLQSKMAADQAHAQADKQLAQFDAAASKAQEKMSTLVSQHCKEAGLKDGECMVCDGPGVTDEQKTACAGLKPQELAIRKMPAKKDEKAEAKKP
jgi:alpha-D-ribose 1-methylphosphonate 5-triphosphate synthase subunit PhnH